MQYIPKSTDTPVLDLQYSHRVIIRDYDSRISPTTIPPENEILYHTRYRLSTYISSEAKRIFLDREEKLFNISDLKKAIGFCNSGGYYLIFTIEYNKDVSDMLTYYDSTLDPNYDFPTTCMLGRDYSEWIINYECIWMLHIPYVGNAKNMNIAILILFNDDYLLSIGSYINPFSPQVSIFTASDYSTTGRIYCLTTYYDDLSSGVFGILFQDNSSGEWFLWEFMVTDEGTNWTEIGPDPLDYWGIPPNAKLQDIQIFPIVDRETISLPGQEFYTASGDFYAVYYDRGKAISVYYGDAALTSTKIEGNRSGLNKNSVCLYVVASRLLVRNSEVYQTNSTSMTIDPNGFSIADPYTDFNKHIAIQINTKFGTNIPMNYNLREGAVSINGIRELNDAHFETVSSGEKCFILITDYSRLGCWVYNVGADMEPYDIDLVQYRSLDIKTIYYLTKSHEPVIIRQSDFIEILQPAI